MPKKISPEIRFFDKVKITDNCWEWIAWKFENGYGGFGLNKKLVKAHRFSWEYFKGSIPEGLQVLHKCDNPSCVNPDHLWLGTQKDNIKDCVKKGRNNPWTKNTNQYGELNLNSKLTNKQVKEIREKYIPRKYSAYKLAKEYNISPTTVYSIVNGKTWKIKK